jgi:hypothetical protein
LAIIVDPVCAGSPVSAITLIGRQLQGGCQFNKEKKKKKQEKLFEGTGSKATQTFACALLAYCIA